MSVLTVCWMQFFLFVWAVRCWNGWGQAVRVILNAPGNKTMKIQWCYLAGSIFQIHKIIVGFLNFWSGWSQGVSANLNVPRKNMANRMLCLVFCPPLNEIRNSKSFVCTSHSHMMVQMTKKMNMMSAVRYRQLLGPFFGTKAPPLTISK